MSGIRLAGQIVVSAVCRTIPYVIESSDDGVTNFWISLWMNEHGMSPLDLTTTLLSQNSNNQLIVDPMICPTDDCLVVYAVIPNTGTFNYVAVGATDDSAAPVQVAAYCNSACAAPTIGNDISMQPSWRPDGNLIIYKTTLQNNVGNPFPRNSQVRSVLPDGTGDTLIKSSEMSTTGQFYWPQFNFDGSRIGALIDLPFTDTKIYTMNPDGSSFTAIATTSAVAFQRATFAWANTQDVLAYYKWDDNTVRVINGDGTGDTVIYTDPDPFYGLDCRNVWLLDDSSLVYTQYDSGHAQPSWTIGLLDAGGGGFTPLSPERRWYGQSIRSMPRLFPQDGRIWWQEGDIINDAFVSSVMPDGTGYTVEQDLDDVLQTWNTGFAYPG